MMTMSSTMSTNCLHEAVAPRADTRYASLATNSGRNTCGTFATRAGIQLWTYRLREQATRAGRLTRQADLGGDTPAGENVKMCRALSCAIVPSLVDRRYVCVGGGGGIRSLIVGPLCIHTWAPSLGIVTLRAGFEK